MDWEIARTVIAIMGVIVGAATAYLRLSIGKAISEATNEILKEVDQKYATKEALQDAKEMLGWRKRNT